MNMQQLNMVLAISLIVAVVGFCVYLLDVLQGRVTRTTTWRELQGDQWIYTTALVGGSLSAMLTLIAGALLKVQS